MKITQKIFALHFFHLILSRLIMPKSKTYSNEDIESDLRDISERHISISQAAKD